VIRVLVTDVDLGDLFGPEPIDFRKMSLRDYFETEFKEQRSAYRGWKAEQWHWRSILDSLGHVRLGDVDEWIVADFVDSMEKKGGGSASGNTKRIRKSAINALLKFAYRRKHITVLPNIAVFEVVGSTKTVRKKSDPLTLDEGEGPARRERAKAPRHVGGGRRAGAPAVGVDPRLLGARGLEPAAPVGRRRRVRPREDRGERGRDRHATRGLQRAEGLHRRPERGDEQP
jgi:hypothetical protein